MILHLLTDEKFTDYAIKQFSASEMKSELVLIPSNNAMEMVKLAEKCTIVRQNSLEFKELLNRLGEYTGIIFHGMFWGRWQTPILQNVPKNVKVAWYFWGGDIYSRCGFENQFLAPITGFFNRLHNRKKKIEIDTSWEIPIELFKHIDYCLTSEQEEYEFAKQYTGSKFEFIWYTCYSLEETVGSLMNSRCFGSNIWLGNSAAVKNNHFDIMWTLRKSGLLRSLDSGKVIIPLSYGSPWVRNLVLRYGRLLLRKRMQPLTEFMPRNEYNALMLSCSTMIIGYWEPAGQGNIITALWLGMRVYLSEKSMAYNFFKRIGAQIYSIESDLKRYQFTPLSEDVRDENRRVLTKWFSRQHVMEAVQNVVKELSESKKIND